MAPGQIPYLPREIALHLGDDFPTVELLAAHIKGQPERLTELVEQAFEKYEADRRREQIRQFVLRTHQAIAQHLSTPTPEATA